MLYYIVLYYIILCFVYYIMLYYITLYYIIIIMIIIIIIINKTHQYTVEGVQLQLNASLICFNPWRCSPLAAQFVVQRK